MMDRLCTICTQVDKTHSVCVLSTRIDQKLTIDIKLFIVSQKHFLSLNSHDYPYGKKSQIQHLWEECTKWGIKLLVKDAWTEPLSRENDPFLMDRILEVTKNPIHLEHINDGRLYSRFSCLSNIANVTGDIIRSWILQGIPKEDSPLGWPSRRKPLLES